MLEDLSEFQKRHAEWCKATFPGETLPEIIEHLKKETRELGRAPTDASEYADVFMMLVSAANASGVDLAAAVRVKDEINRTLRTWVKVTGEHGRHIEQKQPRRATTPGMCKHCGTGERSHVGVANACFGGMGTIFTPYLPGDGK